MRRGYSILALLIGLMLLSSCASTKPLCLDPDAKLRGDFKSKGFAPYTTSENVNKEKVSIGRGLAQFGLGLITLGAIDGYYQQKK